VEEGSGEEGVVEVRAVVMRMRRVQGLDILFIGEGVVVVDKVGRGVAMEEEGFVGEGPVSGNGVEEGDLSSREGGLFASLGFVAEPKRESAD